MDEIRGGNPWRSSFYIEFYVYHNLQICAKLVGLCARHP